MKEIVVPSETNKAIEDCFQNIVGGEIEVIDVPGWGGRRGEIEVCCTKIVSSPSGCADYRIELTFSFSPQDREKLRLFSLGPVISPLPNEVRLEVDRSSRFFGISAVFDPLGELCLHSVYKKKKPPDYPEWDCLWEEADVVVGKKGNVQRVRVAGALMRGIGRDQEEREVYSLTCFQEEERGMKIKPNSPLGRMFEELSLPLGFCEGESADLGPAKEAFSLVIRKFSTVFREIK